MAASPLIKHGLISHMVFMAEVMPVKTWFVIRVILGPFGYLTQDVVADAMTVRAVPEWDANRNAIAPSRLKNMYTPCKL